MKKTLAIILTLVMIFGIVAFNTSAEETAAEPTVTIVTNKGSAVDEGTETYFTVRFDNFSEIKGIDVEITADEAITLGEVVSYGFKGDDETDINVNYTETNTEGKPHVIRFVDLLTQGSARITFAAYIAEGKTPQTDPKINLTGKYADSGKTFLDVDAPAAGTFEIKRVVAEEDKPKAENVTADESIAITPSEGTFIPQGAVYVKNGDTYTFAEKQPDGSFTAPIAGEYTYQSYNIPTNGITTFGASDDPEDNTRLRFGSYSKVGANNGTMVFEGDWLALKNYYIKNGYTVQQFTKAIYTNARKVLDANPGKKFVYYDVPTDDSKTTVNVYLFAQTKYMWTTAFNQDVMEGNGEYITEYAIRLDGIKENTTYAAVAYCSVNNDVIISKDVKSVKK